MNTPDNKLANRRCDANNPTISTVGTFLFCANLYCGDLQLFRFLSGDLVPKLYHIRLRIRISDDHQNTCMQDIHKKNWKDKPVRCASHKRYNDQLRLSKHKLIAAFVQQTLDTIIVELWAGWSDKCVISKLRNAIPHKNEAKVVKSLGLSPVFKFTSDKSIPF